jgi:hypothetical protein
VSRVPRNPGASRGASGRPVFAIAECVLARSEALLASPFWRKTERIIYWAGVKRDDVWMATTVIRPDAKLTRGSFDTTPDANAKVIQYVSAHGLAFLGQVHTHPSQWVDHSGGDDRDAFMPKENSISIVVPHYGRSGMRPLQTCGVHRYEGGRFRRLAAREIEESICLVPEFCDFSP